MFLDLLKKLKLPLLLLFILSFPLFLGHLIPIEIKSFCYAVSLTMKSILEFLLPFIIFSFVFSCLANFQKGAVFFVLLLVTTIFVSNFTALMYGFTAGRIELSLSHFTANTIQNSPQLIPAWHFYIKKLISNDKALIIGFVAGMVFSIWPNHYAKKLGNLLNKTANGFLRKVFIPLLPLFILGFVFKLEHERLLHTSLTVYGPVLLMIVFSQWLYIIGWYVIAGNFSLEKFLFYIRNVLPATLTGFSTISSAAAMPVLIVSTEKNLADSEQAKMLIPAIINIHTIGSAIGVPILALATLVTFNLPMPSWHEFIIFAFYTALAKYAVAAVPGGVIIVVSPLLETYLGFNSDMIGLITAIYLICDPFGTAANVTGNGVFPILFTKWHKKALQLIATIIPGMKKDLAVNKVC